MARLYEDTDEYDYDHDDTKGDETGPTEPQLMLLCLDYLRDLRRSYVKPDDLLEQHGIRADYLSVAIYALARALPGYPTEHNNHHQTTPNDCRFDFDIANQLNGAPNAPLFPRNDPKSSDNWIAIPNLTTINEEILYPKEPPSSLPDEPYPSSWYVYNDAHPSNQDRLYTLDGLATTENTTLPELVVAGMTTLQVKSRNEAEQDMIQSPLFEQFVNAVEKKGFFQDLNDPDNSDNAAANDTKAYQERYQKVVQKFRTKLAAKAWNEQQASRPSDEKLIALENVDRFLAKRRHSLGPVIGPSSGVNPGQHLTIDAGAPHNMGSGPTNEALAVTPATSRADDDFTVGVTVVSSMTRTLGGGGATANNPMSPTHSDDEREAERLKQKGNAHMQQKEYALAVGSYTAALKISPSGPQSHVYFSNRAAAHLSLRQFHEAIIDSERSLTLQPTYAKAHARLGLAHFLLGDYRQAVEAYTVSLKYDPDNKSSRTYLEKAAKRVAAQESSSGKGRSGSGFSVASEWDSKAKGGETIADADERKKIVNEQEAEKHKLKGNSHMANRNYEAAVESYSSAIKLCPKGPKSHVYYSNRAAALCYLEQYEQAESDSLRSLALDPTYEKGHSRLGLARFFMADYEGAIEAYTAALSYDPDNAASKSYLAKAKSRLHQQQGLRS